MQPEIDVKVKGSTHRLAMPLGGLEMVAETNPVIKEIYGALMAGVWRLDELTAVLRAGIRYGEADVTPEAIVEEHGLEHRDKDNNLVGGAAKIAADLLAAGFRDDAPKGEAVAKTRKKDRSSR